jgi:hypothetical protein
MRRSLCSSGNRRRRWTPVITSILCEFSDIVIRIRIGLRLCPQVTPRVSVEMGAVAAIFMLHGNQMR